MLPAKRWKEAEELLEKQKLFANKIVFIKQTPEHIPFRVLLQGSKTGGELIAEELTICDAERKYTTIFRGLLKDYYLHL